MSIALNLDGCDTQLATEIREKCTAVMKGYKEYKDLINREDVTDAIDKKQKQLMERVQYQVEGRINSMGTYKDFHKKFEDVFKEYKI